MLINSTFFLFISGLTFAQKNKQAFDTTSKSVKTRCVPNAINGENSYQCEDQFGDLDEVVVYRNGIRVNPKNYPLYKQGKVIFTDGKRVRNNNVKFKYRRTVRHYPSYFNDLSSSMTDFHSVAGGNDKTKYSFVEDPSGSNNKVLKIHFEVVDKESSLARQQFSFGKYDLTYLLHKVFQES